MTDYVAPVASRTDPGSPGTSEWAKAADERPLAMFEGANGAPRLVVGALERVAAGNTQRCYNPSPVSTSDTTYIAAWAFGIIQGGSLRMAWESKADVGGDAETGIRITRANVATVYGQNSRTSGTYAASTVDVTVVPGDLVEFVIRDGSSASVYIREMSISTSGSNIYPCHGLFGYIDANDALT